MGTSRTFTGPNPGEVGIIARRSPRRNEIQFAQAMELAMKREGAHKYHKAKEDRYKAMVIAKHAFDAHSNDYALTRQAFTENLDKFGEELRAKHEAEQNAALAAALAEEAAANARPADEDPLVKLRRRVEEIRRQNAGEGDDVLQRKQKHKWYSRASADITAAEHRYKFIDTERDRVMQQYEAHVLDNLRREDDKFWHDQMLASVARKQAREDCDALKASEAKKVAMDNFLSDKERNDKRKAAEICKEMKQIDTRQDAELRKELVDAVACVKSHENKQKALAELENAMEQHREDLRRQEAERIAYDETIKKQAQLLDNVHDKAVADEREANWQELKRYGEFARKHAEAMRQKEREHEALCDKMSEDAWIRRLEAEDRVKLRKKAADYRTDHDVRVQMTELDAVRERAREQKLHEADEMRANLAKLDAEDALKKLKRFADQQVLADELWQQKLVKDAHDEAEKRDRHEGFAYQSEVMKQQEREAKQIIDDTERGNLMYLHPWRVTKDHGKYSFRVPPV